MFFGLSDVGCLVVQDLGLFLVFGMLDLFRFFGFWMLSCSGCWIFLFSVFRILIRVLLGFRRILGCFRLLIQRCKRWVEMGNLFDQGWESPDESGDCPTNG
jgi:hypothetical protein